MNVTFSSGFFEGKSPKFFILRTRSKWSKVPKLSSVLPLRSLRPSLRLSDFTFGSFNKRSQSWRHCWALDFSRLKKSAKFSAQFTMSSVAVQPAFGVSMIFYKSLFACCCRQGQTCFAARNRWCVVLNATFSKQNHETFLRIELSFKKPLWIWLNQTATSRVGVWKFKKVQGKPGFFGETIEFFSKNHEKYDNFMLEKAHKSIS